jgi:2-dehydropantoate 2-reductase
MPFSARRCIWPRHVVTSTTSSRAWPPFHRHMLPRVDLPVRKLSQPSKSQEMEKDRAQAHGQASTSAKIHILGVGNIGRLFAHALAKENDPPPISLLLHRGSLLQEWDKAGRAVELTTDAIPDRSGKYDVEVIPSRLEEQQGDIIKNLIVTTKTINTTSALSSIKNRLSSESTILFAQNGMGTMEEVTTEVFPEKSTRPSYLACVTNHGVYSQGPFRSVHAGRADVSIGRPIDSNASQYLIDKVVQASLLSATEVSPDELLQLQMEKLVCNAMINPLTVIFNCRNGELFTRGPIVKLMRGLLVEASQVIQARPELRADPNTASRFSPQNLDAKVVELAAKTGKNTSSMLQDFRAGRRTEIDYINGYIVSRGTEAGVDCENNEILVNMVKSGIVIGVDEIHEHFPHHETAAAWWSLITPFELADVDL